MLNSEQPDRLLELAEKAFLDKDYKAAEKYLKEVLVYYPESAGLYSNLGLVLRSDARLDEAVRYFQKAVSLDPNLADAHYNLGNALQAEGKFEEAKDSYQNAMQINPDLPNLSYDLGTVYKELKQYDKAAFCFRQAIERDPGLSEAYTGLGTVLAEDDRNDEALGFFRKAIALNPKDLNAHLGLSAVFQRKRNFEKAIEYYGHALRMDSQNADIYFNLGLIYREKWELDRAVGSFQKAAELRNDDPEIYCRLGGVQFLRGRLDLAAENYNKALQLKKDFIDVYQSLIMLMNYTGTFGPEEILAAHIQFAETFEKWAASGPFVAAGKRLTGDRMRIGYFSPDFRRHSVDYFIEPVLMAHTRKKFEVFCYSNVDAPDHVTERIRSIAEHWRDVRGLSDDEAAELIRRDEIDVLVDLAGHTSGNRILVLARKPAPVQANWIGYPSTTGSPAMDYKIVDGYTDPQGMTEQFYTETLLRMPESFLCYMPEPDSPGIASLPAIASGHITFGSFNNFAKMSREVVETWADIMKETPDSHLVLKSHCFSDEGTRRFAKEMFSASGVEGDRIELLLYEPSVQTHLSLYGKIDIALDTFPYNGTTTTCEALWMGVPVITLAGATHASRVGVSILSNVGLREHIAGTEEEYVKIAVELSKNVQGLKYLRENLRGMMQNSPLTDAKRFTRELEGAYRMMWENWRRSV